MLHIHSFTFNPFQENTYLLANDKKECIIIDPGCYTAEEKNELLNFIRTNQLQPKLLMNTHCHIDHVFGVPFVLQQFTIPFLFHQLDVPVLNAVPEVSKKYGVPCEEMPTATYFLNENELIELGEVRFKIIHTPGHSPGSISLYEAKDGVLISGDVLFNGSIGRTDFPGGDYDTLEKTIREKLYTLPDATKVYSGHGGTTTIGNEKKSNPFINEK